MQRFEQFFEHIHLFIISLLFGMASFLFKVREGTAKFTGFNAFSEISFSLISAYIAYRLARYFGITEDLLWVFTGIAAWSGTRFLIKMEDVLDVYINKKFDLRVNKEESSNKEQ
jgi:hypothetical protein